MKVKTIRFVAVQWFCETIFCSDDYEEKVDKLRMKYEDYEDDEIQRGYCKTRAGLECGSTNNLVLGNSFTVVTQVELEQMENILIYLIKFS